MIRSKYPIFTDQQRFHGIAQERKANTGLLWASAVAWFENLSGLRMRCSSGMQKPGLQQPPGCEWAAGGRDELSANSPVKAVYK
mmetsp:Transcript_10823/g.25460  ORF Transcript_10823/g.25460 Transcript_10823/m.25460 type:complete len:84 (+) Transcript_10823:333-584(+)